MDFSRAIFADAEACSELDITKVGVFAWVEHHSTEVQVIRYQVGLDGEMQGWWPGQEIPAIWLEPDRIWVAHNHETEKEILRVKLGLDIPSKRWVDTAVLTSIAGMPRNLEDAAQALRLDHQKLDSRTMRKLSQPKSTGGFWTRAELPEEFEKLDLYCAGDVAVTVDIIKRLPPYEALMPGIEPKLFVINDKMNSKGIRVSPLELELCAKIVAKDEQQLKTKFNILVPGVSPKSPKLAAILGLANRRKDTVRDALKLTHNPELKEILELLQKLSKSSTAKIRSLIERLSKDNRLRGAMVFHGAGRTGRWSSMGVQLQNFPRGAGAMTEFLFELLHFDILDLFEPSIVNVISSMLRGLLLGPFLTADFAQIEARTLVTWAGQEDMVRLFRTGGDPYKAMASRIYSKPEDTINKDERFMGKQSVLGCGYQLGRHGFKNMLKVIYDVDISEEEAANVVNMYRAANPKVQQLWWNVDAMVKRCLMENWQTWTRSTNVQKISMRIYKSWLLIKLPSGRVLWYYEPELSRDEQERLQVVYWGRDTKKGGAWGRIKTYGGKVCENVVQAMSRDVMGEAIVRLDEAGFELEFSVHDEVVAEEPDDSRMELFESLIVRAPTWFPELPVAVETAFVQRYQK